MYYKRLTRHNSCHKIILKHLSPKSHIYNYSNLRVKIYNHSNLQGDIYNPKGFTLIELMVVVVILGILASLIVPKLMGRTDEAKVVKAKIDISAIENGLKLYRLDNGNYPTTEQGLLSLIEEPKTEPLPSKWYKDGYLDTKQTPKDPWGREYIYLSPGVNNEYEIISYGADGTPEGEGNDADIKNWELK